MVKRLFKRAVQWLARKELMELHAWAEREGCIWREEIAARCRELDQLKEKHQWLRAQIMQCRVAQAEPPRRGWKVEAYLPEEVCVHYRQHPELQQVFVHKVARHLVDFAIRGIQRMDSQGRIAGLVFEPLDINKKPRAPKWVQVLFDKEGKFKLSPKLDNLLDDYETRVKKASGL